MILQRYGCFIPFLERTTELSGDPAERDAGRSERTSARASAPESPIVKDKDLTPKFNYILSNLFSISSLIEIMFNC